MTAATTEFIDVTGGAFYNSPLVAGTYRAGYVTGYDAVPENQAEIDAMKAAGVHFIRISQLPGLPQFNTGNADVADIEDQAGRIGDVYPAIQQRRSLGITSHTVYCSLSILASIQATIPDASGVWYWVADYAWSAAQSINLLAAHPDWGATQFGDPNSNPLTICPGTSTTLWQAQADIDMGSGAWLALFCNPTPAPVPPPANLGPAWPFPADHYLGTPRKDPKCHSGYYSAFDAHIVSLWQQRMRDRGWYYQGQRLTVDGRYGLNEPALNQGASPAVCGEFQAEFGLADDDLVGPKTWEAAWAVPVTS